MIVFRAPRRIIMQTRKLAFPLLAFAGGAILGRVLGLKNLVRGAMTAAAVTGIAQPAVLETRRRPNSATRRRKVVHRGAHRRSPQKKSSPL
jgi:hypothetical protein